MSNTINNQWQFLQDVSALIDFATKLDGVKLTGGDLWQDNAWHRKHSGGEFMHIPQGNHPKRMAIDLNLFIHNVYIRGAHPVYTELGRFWTDLDNKNRWGGDFSIQDYNHFERHT